jgi:hypothetical protein
MTTIHEHALDLLFDILQHLVILSYTDGLTNEEDEYRRRATWILHEAGRLKLPGREGDEA